MKDHQIRSRIHPKQTVKIKIKNNGVYDRETTGKVQKILTPSDTHYRGIKVMLTDGTVGRVVEIVKPQKGDNLNV